MEAVFKSEITPNEQPPKKNHMVSCCLGGYLSTIHLFVHVCFISLDGPINPIL